MKHAIIKVNPAAKIIKTAKVGSVKKPDKTAKAKQIGAAKTSGKIIKSQATGVLKSAKPKAKKKIIAAQNTKPKAKKVKFVAAQIKPKSKSAKAVSSVLSKKKSKAAAPVSVKKTNKEKIASAELIQKTESKVKKVARVVAAVKPKSKNSKIKTAAPIRKAKIVQNTKSERKKIVPVAAVKNVKPRAKKPIVIAPVVKLKPASRKVETAVSAAKAPAKISKIKAVSADKNKVAGKRKITGKRIKPTVSKIAEKLKMKRIESANSVKQKTKSVEKTIEKAIETEIAPRRAKPKKTKPISSAVFRGRRERYDFQVYPLDAEFENVPAIYIISKRKTDRLKRAHHALVCIGQTDSIFTELKKHTRGKCVKKNQANVISILPEASEKRRLKIEEDLKAAHAIACNIS